MRKFIAIVMVFLFLANTNAQNGNDKLNKEVKLEKIDKNTDLAFVFSNGNLVEKGLLKNGKREGVWQSFNERGTLIAEASFVNGKKDGVWVIYDRTDVKYVLHYKNDLRIKANDLAIAD